MNPRRIVRAVALAVGLAGVTAACTPDELDRWVAWHAVDPEAAIASLPPKPEAHWVKGDCDSFTEELAAVGLPVDTFKRIAWRETRCDPNAWVVDHDDTGGALMGLNFKGSMAGYWRDACKTTIHNIRGNVPLIMRCTAVAYRDAGLRPWRATA